MVIATDPRWHLLFDLLAWGAAALMARWLYRWRLREVADRVARHVGVGYLLALAGGAVAGAWLLGSWNTSLSAVPHLSHSVAGALAGGIAGVELYKLAAGVRVSTGVIWVGPLAIGIAVGRLGCLFAGLPDETFGTPSSLAWAVELGDGVARHPVQLYESLAMLAFLAVYLVALKRRAGWAMERGFYGFVAVYGAQRFLWEFFKPYPRLFLGLDIFQLCAAVMIAYALIFDARARRRPRPQGEPLAVLRPDDQPV